MMNRFRRKSELRKSIIKKEVGNNMIKLRRKSRHKKCEKDFRLRVKRI